MKNLRFISSVLLTFLLGVLIFAGPKPSSPHAPNLQYGNIIGVVHDPTAAPIAGAKIKFSGVMYMKNLQSDKDGKFEHKQIPPGNYTLTVEKEGFQKAVLSPFHVNAKTCELINIHMVKHQRVN